VLDDLQFHNIESNISIVSKKLTTVQDRIESTNLLLRVIIILLAGQLFLEALWFFQ
jgi:hypothetical protein